MCNSGWGGYHRDLHRPVSPSLLIQQPHGTESSPHSGKTGSNNQNSFTHSLFLRQVVASGWTR